MALTLSTSQVKLGHNNSLRLHEFNPPHGTEIILYSAGVSNQHCDAPSGLSIRIFNNDSGNALFEVNRIHEEFNKKVVNVGNTHVSVEITNFTNTLYKVTGYIEFEIN